MDEKPLAWLGSALNDLRAFSAEARRQAGHDLFLVQQGLEPSDWRPMPSVGAGVVEIRIHTDREYRVFYIAKFEDAIYVLHAFEKRTQKTAKRDLDSGRARYAQLIQFRRGRRPKG